VLALPKSNVSDEGSSACADSQRVPLFLSIALAAGVNAVLAVALAIFSGAAGAKLELAAELLASAFWA
ncbi:MAG TPA: hypothetical protein DIW64_16760, partial [Cellvibrio sp.]|nr:hypothetical protein [Cellvibrio sp.]